MNTFVVFYLRHRRHSEECAALLGVALSSLPGTWLQCYEPNDSQANVLFHFTELPKSGRWVPQAETLSKEHFYPNGVECAPDSSGLRSHCRPGLTSTYMLYHRISTQLEPDQSPQYAYYPC